MRKTAIAVLVILALCPVLFAQAASEETVSFVASTSWTASYADLAGVDDIRVIAPASLRHPPEYELVPSDIVAIQNADYFVSAGYERMMAAIQEGIPSDHRTDIHISTGNTVENITAQADLIASYTGTEVRYQDYVDMIEEARSTVQELGLDSLNVFCQNMLAPLALDIGLNVSATFQGELSASQIEEAVNADYDLIIDNYHSPSAAPLDGLVDCPVIVWRNFPETVGRGALESMVRQNLDTLFSAVNQNPLT